MAHKKTSFEKVNVRLDAFDLIRLTNALKSEIEFQERIWKISSISSNWELVKLRMLYDYLTELGKVFKKI